MKQVIEFILYPGALGLDVTGPLEVFNTANDVAEYKGLKNSGYEFRFTAEKKGAVPMSSGLKLYADSDFSSKEPADILFVPGGNDLDSIISDKTFMEYMYKKAKSAKRIVSVCKGSFILAAAGILKDKKAATHWIAAEEMQKKYCDVLVQADDLFVEDENIFTSAGVSSGIDLALYLVEKDMGVSIAIEAARLLVVYFKRPGFQSQFSMPLKAQEEAGEKFKSLHNWIVKNLSSPITVESMAEFSSMSPRNFARVFKNETGITPNKYLENLRLEKAREIMISGDYTLEYIAYECGFIREERFRRAFLRKYGITPSQYRMHFDKR